MGSFPMCKALQDEARRALAAKGSAIKKAERLEWEIGRAHCLALSEGKLRDRIERAHSLALLENKLRHIKAVRVKTEKINAVLKDGKVTSLKAFERLMLKAGA